MSQLSPKRTAKRGRLFSTNPISPEELERRQAENKALYAHCYPIFQEIQVKYLNDHYNWFVIIEPESGGYTMDVDEEVACEKINILFPDKRLLIFCLNETGACGRIGF